jgi:hypothetical protein
MMERGGPIVFTNSQFVDPAPAPPPVCGQNAAGPGMQDFTSLYARHIRVITAARLSASFPYVSPAARTFVQAPLCSDFHMLDGGYFDNYGIFSLIMWLQKGLDPAAPQFKQILMLRLIAFPNKEAYPTSAGWEEQITDPVEGFLNARTTAQANAGDTAADLLKRALKSEGVELLDPKIQFDARNINPELQRFCTKPPLNWVLTGKQAQCFSEVWASPTDDLRTAIKIAVDYVEGQQ